MESGVRTGYGAQLREVPDHSTNKPDHSGSLRLLAWSCKPAHEAFVALAVLAIEVSTPPEVAIFIKEDYD